MFNNLRYGYYYLRYKSTQKKLAAIKVKIAICRHSLNFLDNRECIHDYAEHASHVNNLNAAIMIANVQRATLTEQEAQRADIIMEASRNLKPSTKVAIIKFCDKYIVRFL